jgi:GNAT superfamily N-acetyltransferase
LSHEALLAFTAPKLALPTVRRMRIEPLTFPAPGGGARPSSTACVTSAVPAPTAALPPSAAPATTAGLSLLDSLVARTVDLSSLAEVLIDCVEGGASVGWVDAPSTRAATAWWSAFLADPDHRTWVGRDDTGRIVATASLVLTPQANGAHRAEVVKLLVHRQARGNGFAPGLVATIERFARAEGLTLLTLDTETGSLAESLYRRWGWTEAGVVPGFARSTGGALVSTTIFYKRLDAR